MNIYQIRVFSSILLLLLAVSLSGKTNQPNVILMMADDLGYNDLSCYGSERQKTPVLDKLAAEGIRLTDFYAGATVCTPSRMALLTGAYPPRVGWRGGVVGYG
ncbi:MAG: sulfatase-like hydrolase/transferase, partial [Opitutae bacterium]|nr:sulfatase-like hydrolase/transferase [Opitutae bacterium]